MSRTASQTAVSQAAISQAAISQTAISQASLQRGLTGFCAGMILLPTLFNATLVQATVKISDRLLATDNCEALQSIKKRKNADNIRLVPGESYSVIGKNRAQNASHYLLQIEGIRFSQRWVPVDCGQLTATPETVSDTVLPEPSSSAEPEQPGPEEPSQDEGDLPSALPEAEGSEEEQQEEEQPELNSSLDGDFLLALSWQPAFCETRPTKTECRNQTEDSFEAGNLALHGLWPQPRGNDYCGVSAEIQRLDKSRRWDELPPIELSSQTREALAEQMPGYASGLHLHEWYKHGTCYSNSPEEYYQESLALMDQINDSLVQVLFEENVGDRLSSNDIRQAFDQAFGTGAGQKVEVTCSRDINQGRRRMVQELRIRLTGEIQPGTDVAELLQDAPRVRAGCSGGWVDRAGVDR